ncbi:MAG: response regulator [Bacteroidota bacterium]|nr:response regulator [Bacteroidota bacterium]
MLPTLPIPSVKNIIIADDDWDDQILFKEAVDNHQYAPFIQVFSSGNKLIKALESGPLPDLIVLDLNMPNKNGIECLQEIRSNPRQKNIPIVIFTTSKDIRDIELCYIHGAQLFFSKPHTFELLKNMVHYMISIDWLNFPKKTDKDLFIEIATKGLY